jgi:Leucine-rich repeat (LRR) protein
MLHYVTTLKSVCELDIIGQEVRAPGKDLQPLKNMTWLKRLYIEGEGESESDHWEFIAQLQHLESLTLWRPGSIERVNLVLSPLKSLKSLSVSGINNYSAKQLTELRDLEFAHLGRIQSPTIALTALRSCENLWSLSMDVDRLAQTDLDLIVGMRQLKSLSIRGRSLDALSPFDQLTNLEWLILHFNEYPSTEERIVWENLKLIKYLSLRFDEFPDSEMWNFLAKMPQMVELQLYSSVVKRGSIESLRNHVLIRDLRLGAIELSDRDLMILVSLPRLQTLEVGNPPESPWCAKARMRLNNVRLLNPPK